MRDIKMDEQAAATALWAALRDGKFDQETANLIFMALPNYQKRADLTNFLMNSIVARDHRTVFWGDRLLTLDKAMGFFDEATFASAFDAVWSDYPYDQYLGKQTIAWRLHTLVWAGKHAMALPEGDFVECGVFRGDMSWVVGTVAGVKNSNREAFLYDSFIGLDPRQVRSGDYGDTENYLEIVNPIYAENLLGERVKSRFSDWSNYSVIQGFVPDTFAASPPSDKLAWVHIDLNSPQAEKACLEYLVPRMVPGGLVILDDYGWTFYGRQKEVADAYFAELGLSVLELPTGQGLAIKI